jgi:hypothetical protein
MVFTPRSCVVWGVSPTTPAGHNRPAKDGCGSASRPAGRNPHLLQSADTAFAFIESHIVYANRVALNFLCFSLFCFFLAAGVRADGLARDEADLKLKPDVMRDSSTTNISEEITKVLRASYEAMEKKKSELALSFYHPRTSLISSKEELDRFFSETDVSYTITNIRYIGNDGENFVIVYREVTEFRRKGEVKLVDKEDTDVLMVFRKHDGKFKIFTSRSLKPGS